MFEKTIESFDKTKIALNHFQKDGRDNVFIICHGFSMAKDAKLFFDLSKDFFRFYDVIIMDQRGHGKSQGAFTFSSKEHLDIKAVIDYAKKIYLHIYLIGFSLGAASSIIEVAEYKNVNALIIVSPPISFKKIENRFLHKNAVMPAIQKFGTHIFKLRIGNILSKKVNPIDVIDKISPIPLLILQGDKDPIVFEKHAELLYNKALKPKKISIIKNGLHAEDLYRQNPEYFITICISWIKDIYMPGATDVLPSSNTNS